jgi:flagellar basal body rod protein FlgF
MIEASQRMININSQGEIGGMNPAIKRHFELQIKTLQNAPEDEDKLEWLLKEKERQKEGHSSP